MTRHGSDDTYFPLAGLLVVAFGLLVPVGLAPKLWYYAYDLVWKAVALYFLVSNIWCRVRVNGTWAVVWTGRPPSPHRHGTEEKRRR